MARWLSYCRRTMAGGAGALDRGGADLYNLVDRYPIRISGTEG